MKRLLNVLYITMPDVYLSLDNENVVALKDNAPIIKIPLLNIESIICFNYLGISPALMGKCIEKDILISFISPNGKFLATINGRTKGSILFRKKQYQISDDESQSALIAKNFIIGKLYNCRMILSRLLRDHSDKINVANVIACVDSLKVNIIQLRNSNSLGEIRGIEGDSARKYFGVFNELIINQKEDFILIGRTKRPPLDNVNALLSFFYTLLSSEVQAAVESSMLDSYAGFLHRDRLEEHHWP